MSTNFYLRRTKPILCFPEFHLGKRSAGWRPLYRANRYDEDTYHLETERPIIQSCEDIRRYVDGGEWEIVNDEGTEFTFEEFEAYMDDNFKYETDDTRESHIGTNLGCWRQPDGTEWTEADFY